jgi:hypothetical protein
MASWMKETPVSAPVIADATATLADATANSRGEGRRVVAARQRRYDGGRPARREERRRAVAEGRREYGGDATAA